MTTLEEIERMATEPQRKMLDDIRRACESWDGFAPHSAGEWQTLKALMRLGLAKFVAFGQCADGCERAGDCPHDVQIYALTDAGQHAITAMREGLGK